MKQQKLSAFTLIVALLLTSGVLSAQSATFGFFNSKDQPQTITALAYPDFTAERLVMVEGSVFTFLAPSGIRTFPAVTPLPSRGILNDLNGHWVIDRLTPDLYAAAGLNAADLNGYDVYFAVLNNSPELDGVTKGKPIELFSFTLPEGCYERNIKMLTNNGSIQSSIYEKLSSNANNAFSVAIDDFGSMNIYAGNNRKSEVIQCKNGTSKPKEPTGGVDFFATSALNSLQQNFPNPVSDNTTITFQLASAGPATFVFSDAAGRRILERKVDAIAGFNQLELNRDELRSSGVVIYTIVAGDFMATKKMIVLK